MENKICLCAIGRFENRYAREYVMRYKSLGFDKLVIYDNNHGNEEHFEDVLNDFISDGFVDVINFRDREAAQLAAYNDCYQRYGNDYDWMAFFDFDEFLTLRKHENIKDFLKCFDCGVIKINWMVYGDNDLVHYVDKPVNERFLEPLPFDFRLNYSFPENCHVKSIVRCGLGNVRWGGTPHIPCGPFVARNADGKLANTSPFENYSFDTAYLKHFPTKTIEEYVTNKMVRGVADRTKSSFDRSYGLDHFFKYNKMTHEKEEFLKTIKNK